MKAAATVDRRPKPPTEPTHHGRGEPGDLVIELCLCGQPLDGAAFVCPTCEARFIDDPFPDGDRDA